MTRSRSTDGRVCTEQPTPPATVHDVDTDLVGAVDRTLGGYLAERTADADRLDPDFSAATGELRTFVLSGGKRVRPTFAWWGWRGAGGGDDAAGPDDAETVTSVLRVVSALELIQACALVHDDLIDGSAVRRGEPTLHTAFTTRHAGMRWEGVPERFGLAAAVLLGDVALAWADDLFLSSGLTPPQLGAAIEPWRAMRTEMLAGQYLDVITQARADESVDAAVRIDQLKTAAYTVGRPLHLGAAIAGGSPELLAAYRSFGADIGVAFQLRDDLLGVFGDPAVTGKPTGEDLREGKRTVLLALALVEADRTGRHADAALLAGVGQPDLGEREVAELSALLVDLGAVAAVEQWIIERTSTALAALEAAPIAEPAATRLAELAVAATVRKR
jgi:geranylgeranyl diphosphate synthase, type I